MKRTTIYLALAACLVLLTPLFAVPADLQCSIASINGPVVSITVHNPNSNSETAHVQLGVVMVDASTASLSSTAFTLQGGGTTTVNVVAPNAVVGITDGPEPI